MEEVELGEERVLPFVLENITRSHTGEYACSVSNEIGTGASGSIAIDVLCKYSSFSLSFSPSLSRLLVVSIDFWQCALLSDGEKLPY